MRAVLRSHPDFANPAVAIEADVARTAARLSLTYRLTGDLDGLRIPEAAPPARTDELWRHTCFEAFVAPASDDAYYELNFSPSGQWAAYRFDGYRRGMAPAEAAPWSDLKLAKGKLTLRARIDLAEAPELIGAWRLGLSAVVEAADGSLSYWSVAHPPGRPDFHHRDCLALELAAPQDA